MAGGKHRADYDFSTYRCPKCKDLHRRVYLKVNVLEHVYDCIKCGFKMEWYKYLKKYMGQDRVIVSGNRIGSNQGPLLWD